MSNDIDLIFNIEINNLTRCKKSTLQSSVYKYKVQTEQAKATPGALWDGKDVEGMSIPWDSTQLLTATLFILFIADLEPLLITV